MENILEELGLVELKDVFLANDITPNVVLGLKDDELATLGISSIGDRLRERCRDDLRGKDEHESPIVKGIKTLIKNRSGNSKLCMLPNNNRKTKETRRVVIGWKHNDGANKRSSCKLVNCGKGGGKQEIDVNRSFTVEETSKLFADCYFPNGLNTASGLRLESLTHFVATFTGQPISELAHEVCPFTFGDVENKIGTSPIRLYLHTKLKDAGNQPGPTSEDDDLTGNPPVLPDLTEDVTENPPGVFDPQEDVTENPPVVPEPQEDVTENSPIVSPTPEDQNLCDLIVLPDPSDDLPTVSFRTRQFFILKMIDRLLMIAVENDILYGEEGMKFFTHSLEKLDKKTYEMCGSMTAFSILHGGPGLPVLHPAVYGFLAKQEAVTLPAITSAVMDFEMREKLLAVEQATYQEEYDLATEKISDWCLEQGLSLRNYQNIDKKQELLDLLVKNEVLFRVQAEISQFRDGMNRVGGFYDQCLHLSPKAMERLLVNKEARLTLPIFRALYDVNYSAEGSNDRRRENDVIYCLEAFLADSEGGSTGITLAQVLSFWTGASAVPPLGFHKNLEVSFVKSDTKRLPVAHTCTMVLSLWQGYSDPDVFQDDMVKAIGWGGGFHLV